MAINSAIYSSEKQDYETPPEFFATLDAEFHFTLDPCAEVETAKCKKFFTPFEDGLAQDWGKEIVYMNPPYGRDLKTWMAKAVLSYRHGATVVCLVPARTDADWWHRWVVAFATEVRFVRGRLVFVGQTANAPFPCAVVVYQPGKKRQRLVTQEGREHILKYQQQQQSTTESPVVRRHRRTARGRG